ncbi:MAG: metallophosphoesterase [Bacteroidetes bacterium]|nr:metallophosphoesterase [Bacteroidota bacterium]
MHYRFLHIADAHLGRHQHASPERYADYFTALASVVAYALREQVNALLIAGDLFDEQEPSAETLRRAMETLRPLREAGIDVVAIEGNHDRRKRSEPAGALDLLDSEGYLRLLRPRIEEQTLTIDEYERGKGGALWRPREDVAIAGLGFLPHNIEEYYTQTAAQLPSDTAVILLTHVMVVRDENALEYGCVAMEDLAPLAEPVTCLLLGHRHTRVGLEGETDGWIFNPGSLEYVNTLDYRLPADLRGFFDMTIGTEGARRGEPTARPREGAEGARRDEPTARPREAVEGAMPEVRYAIADGVLQSWRGRYHLTVRHIPTEKRPAHTLHVDITGCGLPEDVIAAVRRAADGGVDDALRERHPILVVRLQGAAAISRVRIPRAAIAELLREECNALHVEVMDRDLLGAASPSTLLADDGGLEQVADRARAIAADLLQARGIAHGREAEFSAVLLDLKAQLQGSARSPSETVLERMREQLRPFVESESDIAENADFGEDGSMPMTSEDDSAGEDDA